MKTTLTVLLFTIATITYGQKLQKPLIDKITGDTTIATSTERIFSKASFTGTVGEQVATTIFKARGKYFLALNIQTAKTSIFSIDSDHKAYLKLSDGVVVTLNSIGDDLSKYTSVSYGSSGKAVYELSKDQLKDLQTNSVTFARVEYSDGTFEYDIKPKQGELLKQQASLMN